MTAAELLRQPCRALLQQHPYLADFFAAHALPLPAGPLSLSDYFSALTPEQLDRLGLDREALTGQLLGFMTQMESFRGGGREPVRKVTVLGGRDKSGRREEMSLELRSGDVVCVVGPTGSGKSRLLADIECLAQGDTPTGRRILLDDAPPDESARLSGEQRLVAQLSQNMNFVMDLSVREFLQMHAESRLVEGVEAMIERIYATAVDLAGEPFTLDTPVTALSGGQSRALMIADVACLSVSPIVLIDEIENAGVDRRRALELLVREEKIVLMATHDPLLALSGDRRLVIKNGAIAAVLETSAEERAALADLDTLDRRLASVREQLRRGERVVLDAGLFAPDK
ncbi:ATP-binding cassette domain-containing protein [Trichloromonas sp.]|uniref:ATP-binding cassette domain-containing protein n=1 Tax=Trichloromonas sp. TaxID=3069249 RepID=UPI003D8142BB